MPQRTQYNPARLICSYFNSFNPSGRFLPLVYRYFPQQPAYFVSIALRNLNIRLFLLFLRWVECMRMFSLHLQVSYVYKEVHRHCILKLFGYFFTSYPKLVPLECDLAELLSPVALIKLTSISTEQCVH